MAFFSVRVELHEADDADYHRLYAAMETAGYRRIVTSDDGAIYQLPAGEFDLVADGAAPQVMEHAYRVAAGVKSRPEPSVFVTQAAYRAWRLPKIGKK